MIRCQGQSQYSHLFADNFHQERFAAASIQFYIKDLFEVGSADSSDGKLWKTIQIQVAIEPEEWIVPDLLDSLKLSRYGGSSGELDSLMILNPKTGNRLEKAIRQ